MKIRPMRRASVGILSSHLKFLNLPMWHVDTQKTKWIIFFDVTECVADIAFVIDNSGSIRDNDPPGGNNWQLILDFVKSIVEMFTIAPDVTRVAVIDFGQ